MANSTKNPTLGFRAPQEYHAEWEQFKLLAKQEGKEFRDWLFPRIRQSLAPRPKPVADSANDALKRGRRIGLMIGRLDMVFQMEREEDLEAGWVTDWIRRYPDCVDDVRLALLAKTYGVRFEQWWQWLTDGETAPR